MLCSASSLYVQPLRACVSTKPEKIFAKWLCQTPPSQALPSQMKIVSMCFQVPTMQSLLCLALQAGELLALFSNEPNPFNNCRLFVYTHLVPCPSSQKSSFPYSKFFLFFYCRLKSYFLNNHSGLFLIASLMNNDQIFIWNYP